ncbi:benzoate/H(+) symporter BenE family transporter [Allokutzneria sp. NRRL B-24872]|uniref:benzoate/H(+) symporter BenE family transporter n=1 Tax=Allokutzneria sp. NRRL B-24872 TaxID=1137961 RepID=UPI000A365C0E|nr:benzoate/H(+) symporter BenE family transporter [Allokutzneria sp. NRRL B-24872]
MRTAVPALTSVERAATRTAGGPSDREDQAVITTTRTTTRTADRTAQRRSFVADASLSSFVAALIAIVVSYSGPIMIVLTAAQAGHLTQTQTTSWLWALSIGAGLSSIALSLKTRMPVIAGWSTPGAALLVTSIAQYSYPAAIGAFVISALTITLIGFSGVFGKLIALVPDAVVSAMLAGILFSFGIDAFRAVGQGPLVTAAVLLGYIFAKRFSARYAVLAALVLGVLTAALSGGLRLTGITFHLASPLWTTPAFDLAAIIGIGVPLFAVTMASQNAPGLAVLHASGHRPNDRLLIGGTGLASLVMAPFGGHAVNLAAITAAICTGEEAHPDTRKRYPAGVFCGLLYLLVGTFGAALLGVFTALPKELVAAIAGVALLGALMSGLSGAMALPEHREPALVTFLVTASGMALFGIGSAFWGLIFGLVAHLVLTAGRRSSGRHVSRARRGSAPGRRPRPGRPDR